MSEPEKKYTSDDLCLAFVSGAAWWEYEKTRWTMWQSDQDKAYEYAQKHIEERVARLKMHREQAR